MGRIPYCCCLQISRPQQFHIKLVCLFFDINLVGLFFHINDNTKVQQYPPLALMSTPTNIDLPLNVSYSSVCKIIPLYSCHLILFSSLVQTLIQLLFEIPSFLYPPPFDISGNGILPMVLYRIQTKRHIFLFKVDI